MPTLDKGASATGAEVTQRRLWIHAPNIHRGGGRTLLLAVLESLAADHGPERPFVTLDSRLTIDEGLAKGLNILRVAPTLRARLFAEWHLSKQTRPGDLVLCFGNLPPLFAVPARVVLFLQNYYLIAGKSVLQLPIKLKTRLRLERLWLRSAVNRCHAVIVQSPTMQRLVQSALGMEATVAPFISELPAHGRPAEGRSLDFLYVASGEPHKNHRQLIEAWVHLAERGTFPSLGLTLDPSVDRDLCTWIGEKSSAHSLRIKMLGTLSASQLELVYLSSRSLIFPSLFESFGLPLLEAQSYDLPILASERDYVRDVIAPAQSFDPESAVSIRRAVERHLGLAQETASPISAHQFLNKVRSVAWSTN